MERFVKTIVNWIGTPTSLIIHSLCFVGIFALRFVGVSAGDILLLLTTIVSLEAIYLSIFIQITVNQHTQEIMEVKASVEEVSESVEEVQESVEEVQETVEEVQETVEDEQKENVTK